MNEVWVTVELNITGNCVSSLLALYSGKQYNDSCSRKCFIVRIAWCVKLCFHNNDSLISFHEKVRQETTSVAKWLFSNCVNQSRTFGRRFRNKRSHSVAQVQKCNKVTCVECMVKKKKKHI